MGYGYINKLRKILKEKLSDTSEFHGHEQEYAELRDLVLKAVRDGESNSILLVGPSGAGKTTLMNNVLKNLEYLFVKDALLVRLHGLLQGNDRLALKSMCSQMQLETVVEGKVLGSFAENLAFILASLKSGSRCEAKCIVFVLEDFDLFCFHRNQTLIYNLFDVAQSAQTPICVVGLTRRLDVIELLEKRVKSRFSHRQVFIYSGIDASHSRPSESELTDHMLKRIQTWLTLTSDKIELPTSFHKKWNNDLREFLESRRFQNIIQRFINLTINERTLKNLLLLVVCQLSDTSNILTIDMFEEVLESYENDDFITILQSLSILELCLVIAMKHHVEIFEENSMNFEIIYNRYCKFVSLHSSMQTTSRTVLMKAFERLQDVNLIMMSGCSIGNTIQKEFQMFKLLVLPEQVADAVKKMSKLPTEVVQWVATPTVT